MSSLINDYPILSLGFLLGSGSLLTTSINSSHIHRRVRPIYWSEKEIMCGQQMLSRCRLDTPTESVSGSTHNGL